MDGFDVVTNGPKVAARRASSARTARPREGSADKATYGRSSSRPGGAGRRAAKQDPTSSKATGSHSFPAILLPEKGKETVDGPGSRPSAPRSDRGGNGRQKAGVRCLFPHGSDDARTEGRARRSGRRPRSTGRGRQPVGEPKGRDRRFPPITAEGRSVRAGSRNHAAVVAAGAFATGGARVRAAAASSAAEARRDRSRAGFHHEA